MPVIVRDIRVLRGLRIKAHGQSSMLAATSKYWTCLLVLALTLSGAAALVRDLTGRRDCATPVRMDLAVSNETLYEQVVQWARDKEVRDWSYAPWNASEDFIRQLDVSDADAAELQCSAVHYASSLTLPEAFVAFLVFWHMPVDISLSVDKQVCRTQRTVFESAVIRVPVLNEVHMTVRHELQSDWELDSSSHMYMYVPWYARLIEPQIGMSLDQSVREKLDAVMHSMCEPPDFPALLRLQRPNASFVRDVSHMPEASFPLQAYLVDTVMSADTPVRRRKKMTLRRTDPVVIDVGSTL